MVFMAQQKNTFCDGKGIPLEAEKLSFWSTFSDGHGFVHFLSTST